MQQEQSRRQFVTQVAALGTAGAVALAKPECLGMLARGAVPMRLDRATRTTFARYLGSTFRIYPDARGPVDVVLIAATALPALGRRPAALRQPFSLVYRSADFTPLPQQTYRVDHAALGTMTLFIVPYGDWRRRGVRYEAIFA